MTSILESEVEDFVKEKVKEPSGGNNGVTSEKGPKTENTAMNDGPHAASTRLSPYKRGNSSTEDDEDDTSLLLRLKANKYICDIAERKYNSHVEKACNFRSAIEMKNVNAIFAEELRMEADDEADNKRGMDANWAEAEKWEKKFNRAFAALERFASGNESGFAGSSPSSTGSSDSEMA